MNDPFDDAGEIPAPLSPAPVATRSPARRHGNSLDRLIGEIQPLPSPGSSTLAGMIVDGCAGEVDETYAKLRSVLGKI